MSKTPDVRLKKQSSLTANTRPAHDAAQMGNSAATIALHRQRIKEALVLHREGNFAGAEEIYRAVLKVNPNNFDALQLMGTIAAQSLQPELAIEYLTRAIILKPSYAIAYNNRGNALKDLGRFDEALANYDRAIAFNLRYVEAHDNRGIVLMAMNRLDEALASFDHALAIKPDYAEAHWNKSLIQLLLGDFEAGWRQYEWRWKIKNRADQPRSYLKPLWQGDTDLRGKRILLYSEQGLGDSIQFCRYVSRVAAQGAIVILEAPIVLAPLLKNISGVAEFINKDDIPPPFDFHCPMLSLPLAFGTRLESISGMPYLSADSERVAKWRSILRSTTHPRLGIAWSGSQTHMNDNNRSLPLSLFGEALLSEIDYICLQNDVRATDQYWLDSHPEIRLVDTMIRDFSDTAALIEVMDLVITVDTSVAHLAGALGKEVWILLPFAPDWRWLLDRSDSPWYDSATLIRQPTPGDWNSVLLAVRQRLEARFAFPPPGVESPEISATNTGATIGK
ncbi:MAG: tetratricopeptide repeat-containing glycosyltransferase family protein [Sulfuritalea sp.]|nr:tetratricopeptide repeat-containing glycosyltransferase family protein [Sulfuritalea sp.]